MPTPLSTRVCSSYICYVVDLIACARSTFGNDRILRSFFSFILTSNKISYLANYNTAVHDVVDMFVVLLLVSC